MNKLASIEQDFRDDSATVIAHVRGFLDDHASALAAEAARVQASPVAQALEAAVLPPGAEPVLARFITEFAAWAGKVFPPAAAPVVDDQGPESDSAAPDVPAPAGTPDAGWESLSAGPVVGGKAF